MSQAIQYNSSVAMTRHPHLLQRAAALTPALHRQRQAPQAIVEAVADPAALNGWRGHTICTPEQFYQQPLRVGDSIIIDFGSHFVGYLQFSCRSVGSPQPAVIADPQLKAIDSVAVRTLQNCMQEVFEDGPKRDRRLWLGDLRLQALVNDVTFGHHDLVRRCLYLFAGHTREDGMVSANVFVQPEVRADDTFLFDYSLFFIDVLYNYLQSTGDTETVGELWPTARRQIELALTRCDPQGLVRDSDDWWAFIDWQAELNKQSSAQGVLIYCLQRALWLAQRVEPQRVADYTATLAQLKE
ncbi:hypothetical protein AE02_03141, partial [Klebsiella variicola]